MSEVMDREQQAAAVETAPPPAPETAAEKTSLWKKWKGMPRKKRRKIVRRFIFLLILIAFVHGGAGGVGVDDEQRGPRLHGVALVDKDLGHGSRLRLTQYYSYAYEGMIHQGQSMDVSIPALMSSIPGTVEAVPVLAVHPDQNLPGGDLEEVHQGAGEDGAVDGGFQIAGAVRRPWKPPRRTWPTAPPWPPSRARSLALR